ncbi:MAG: dUTP diphosphatase [Clostridia bacterium]|nr:dUTP diphosphatase [Clostridia bacterium]MBQ4351023.1 dUTP diphosphatase [Clostridia bacterium]
MSLPVKLKKLRPDARIPAYQSTSAAACDLCAALDAPLTLEPGERALIPTGLAMDFGASDGSVAALIFARSGLAVRQGLALSNGVGVIDADYRGEIKVAAVNLGKEPVTVRPGDRVAQMAFVPVLRASFEEADEIGETERGEGGFGHTGV